MVSKCCPEIGLKLYLEASMTADNFWVALSTQDATNKTDYAPITYELLSQAYTLYEEVVVADPKAQQRCIVQMVGVVQVLASLSETDYESIITKTAQFSAKALKKEDQCHLVGLCAHLFYPTRPTDSGRPVGPNYRNPQRALECLQRSLKLADACTTASAVHIALFVDLLEHYVHFFEWKNPVITAAYVTGLVALIKQHLANSTAAAIDDTAVAVREANSQFLEVVRYVEQKKAFPETKEHFAGVVIPEDLAT